MKILLMNNGSLAHSLSGGTTHLYGLAEVLAKEHDVAFIAPASAEDLLPGAVRRSCYSSRFPQSVTGTILVYLDRMVKASRLARKEPADVVLSLSLLFDVFPALIHKRVHGSTLGIFVFHLVPRRTARSLRQKLQFEISFLAQRIAIRFYGMADVVFVGNCEVRDELKKLGIPEHRMKIQYPATNTEIILQAQPIKKYDVLFLGRMVARKGIYDLVEAARGLDLRIGLVGEGEDRIPLQRFIQERGLDHQFDVTGHLPDPEAHGLLRGCRCLVLPSYEEGYGIVIAEAIVAGKPVITYELPHSRRAFGDGPIYVPVGDKAELRSALISVAEGALDEQTVRSRYKDVRLLTKAQATGQVLGTIITRRRAG